ncbi:phage tail protein [Phascolarctobacterium sp.]
MAMLTGAAINLARFQQSVLASSSSNITALQAYQYAESKADIVKLQKYDELTAQSKKEISNSNYQDEVLLSEESSIDDHKERTATVNVYLQGELRPRATLKLIRSTAEKQSAGVPIGTVLAWPSHTLPTDGGVWLLCNGQSCALFPELVKVLGKSTVPNYQGIFLRGYGSQASTHYGTVTHSSAALEELQGDAIRNIFGSFHVSRRAWNDASGAFVGRTYNAADWKSGSGDNHQHEYTLDASRVVPTAAENRPINRSVNYIIRAA